MITDHVQNILKKGLRQCNIALTTPIPLDFPVHEQFGDISTPVAFQYAKLQKHTPYDLARKIADTIPADHIISHISVEKPGFINFTVSPLYLKTVIGEILTKTDSFGTTDEGAGKPIVVEYSSPNIAKPFSIGHLRSTIIGDAIANLLETTGWQVIRDNHIGDWGTQFGKLIYAIKTWGSLSTIQQAERPVKLLVDLYVRFHTEAEKNPALEDEGRKWFKKLEENDPEARAIWKHCIEWSWKEFDRIYRILGITRFVNNGRGYGESYFEPYIPHVLTELKNKKLLTQSDGAQMIFFPEKDRLAPLMIIKNDGATLYATRDLATDFFRRKTYGPDVVIINEVGAEQTLYFRQLYRAEELLGWFKRAQRVHVGHGLFRFADKKMSTRKGNVIWLEEVITELIAQVKTRMPQKNDDNDTIQKIALGALKWNGLKREPGQPIVFSWDDILSLQGDSGPYMQYVYARCMSVLEKAQENLSLLPSVWDDDASTDVARYLIRYPMIVSRSAAAYAPHHVCTYLYRLAQKYNMFYQSCPILTAETPALRTQRLAITAATAQVIKNGLTLLGIPILRTM